MFITHVHFQPFHHLKHIYSKSHNAHYIHLTQLKFHLQNIGIINLSTLQMMDVTTTKLYI
jgi:hypothetical protein